MKKLLLIAPLALAFACGNGSKENEVEKLSLESEKDKLSYSLGAMNAKSILDAPQANFKKLDKDLVIKGFSDNLNDKDFSDCEKNLIGLFGPYMQDFDTTYLEAGSECFGRITSGQMYKSLVDVNELEKFDLDIIKKGFEQAYLGVDTVNLSEEDQKAVMESYAKEVEARLKAEEEMKFKPFWDDVMTKNVTPVSEGVYIETIKEGAGGSPQVTDDVEAHYTLYDMEGNKMESSLDSGNPLKMNLGGLIRGWQIGFPAMKKGGKYNLYIPSDLAYRNGPLKFEIEFINYGPAGTIAPPRQY